MTATPTPVVIVTTLDTTVGQYQELVDSLPKPAKPMKFPQIDGARMWLLATLDQCTSEALWDNPLVEGMAIDNYLVANDDVDPIRILPTDPEEIPIRRRDAAVHREAAAAGASNAAAKLTPREFASEATILNSQSHIVAQTNAPAHLNWLFGLSRQSQLDGNFYDFENYMYDDGANLALPTQPWAYFIDGSGFAIHAVRHPQRVVRGLFD